MLIQGVWTALITPFEESGAIDWKAFEALVADQVAAGVSGVVPCGTTGESPTLRLDEKRQLIEKTVALCRGTRTRVMAGTGSNSTAETVEQTRWAADHGADAALVVTPYYNKPTPAGLEAHYLVVAEAASCPVVLYNVPGRTGVSLSAESISKLSAHPRIRAIKEATGNVALTSEILHQVRKDRREITVLSGDDATYLPLLSVGARGVVSVASNLFPRGMVALQAAWEQGQASTAIEIHDRFYPLFRDLFVEANPGPIKAALSWAGRCSSQLRAPLARLSSESLSRLERALAECRIEKGKPQ